MTLIFVFCSFKEPLVILFPIIVDTDFQPKIRIMTTGANTVLKSTKDPGGMTAVITLT